MRGRVVGISTRPPAPLANPARPHSSCRPGSQKLPNQGGCRLRRVLISSWHCSGWALLFRKWMVWHEGEVADRSGAMRQDWGCCWRSRIGGKRCGRVTAFGSHQERSTASRIPYKLANARMQCYQSSVTVATDPRRRWYVHTPVVWESCVNCFSWWDVGRPLSCWQEKFTTEKAIRVYRKAGP
jgi:hypothetical protein